MLSRAASGIRFNEHMEEEDGPLVFLHACKLGLEGIVSNGATRFIVRAARRTGSSRRIRMHRL
jgi:hypothetical protein